MSELLDIRSKLDAMSDEEVLRLHANMRLLRDTAAWNEIAATFPDPEPAPGKPWPLDYAPIIEWRERARLAGAKLDPAAIKGWYRDRPVEFINHWAVTYDPRRAATGTPKMPFVLFKRQRDLVTFIVACLKGEHHALLEKARDMGATWVCCLLSVWLWTTWPGASVGWGSRKEELVDRIGDPDSIFEKIRMAIRELPSFLIPAGLIDDDHLVFMKCLNPETGATITGECGDNIGRGGRSLIYFKDESAHYARPEKIEAALADNTNIQIDLSTPKGLGNVFHRKREAGQLWTGGKLVKGCSNVFVMDWSEHPAKDKKWYDERRASAVANGLLHVFKQEVERDYAASVEGIIIRQEWVKAAIDAHIKLGLPISGRWSGGLDVADGVGGDTNALALFKGIVLRRVDNWGDVDTGATTRRALLNCEGISLDLQYDCVGIGAGVKAEANRLAEDDLMPDGINLIPWNAGAGVIDKDSPVNPDDRDSPTNGDMFANMKAQAWWTVARRFEKTYRAVEEGVRYDPSELISIDSTIPLLRQVERELCQPTIKKRPSDLKLIVDKTPEGSRSPNLGDSIIMAAFPLAGLAPVYRTKPTEITVAPFRVPNFWRKGYALKIEPGCTTALFGAYDASQDILYVTVEHLSSSDAAANVAAIRARGTWLPGVIESDETNLEARQAMAAFYIGAGLNLVLADRSLEAGISDVRARLATARLKLFATCQRTLKGYRSFRYAEDGKLVGGGLMDCLRVLARPSTIALMTEPPKTNADLTRHHEGDTIAGY